MPAIQGFIGNNISLQPASVTGVRLGHIKNTFMGVVDINYEMILKQIIRIGCFLLSGYMNRYAFHASPLDE